MSSSNPDRRTDVVVIGGGQAGLAMSHCLVDHGIDHVVLEKGAVAQAWRSERWDSLRLLTPNWMTRLPGFRYQGPDPDGFMTAAEVGDFLEAYRASFDPPIVPDCDVDHVEPTDAGFVVNTTRGPWRCRVVVVATGACRRPRIPAVSAELPDHIRQLVPHDYRNPDQVADGGVLVVGASASGVQIADELARSGRDVTIAVGDHVRVPRTYRGMDIQWWLDTIGQLDERHDEVPDLARARRLPSLQLVGSPERRSVDVNALCGVGVRPVGRLAGVRAGRAMFSGSLRNMLRSADLKQTRLLDRIDEYATEVGLDGEIGEPGRPASTTVTDVVLDLDLREIGAVVWATGYRPHFPFLPASMLDAKGAFAHDAGVGAHPGTYVLGQQFQRRRKSSFIDGVGDDAKELADHLVSYLDREAATAGSVR